MQMKKYMIFLVCLLLVACGGGGGSSGGDSGSSAASWSITTIDNIGTQDDFNSRGNDSLALDSNNRVHIGYSDLDRKEMKYATNVAGFWDIYVIDTDIADSDVSIAVDSKGVVHIVYQVADGSLRYTTNASGVWVTKIIDSNARFYNSNSLAVDSNDNIHISYTGNNRDIKYATNASGSWVLSTIYTVERSLFDNISLTMDSLNNAHLSFYEEGANEAFLQYMTNATGTWSREIIDNDIGVGGYLASTASVAIDSLDKVHIGYNNMAIGILKYATNVSGSWVVSELGELKGQGISLAIDSHDRVHFTSHELNTTDLIHITNVSGLWNAELVTNEGGYGYKIKIDSEDKIHISYIYSVNYYQTDLRYAFK